MKISFRIKSLLLTMAGFLGIFGAGHGQANENISIVTTIFPEYDWVQQIIGEDNPDIELSLLVENGIDLHSYQPSIDDLIQISSADMFVYIGGVSDTWVDDAIHEALNQDMSVINLMDVLGDSVKEEESIEGMEKDHAHDHETHADVEYDEHIWLSLKNTHALVQYIAEQISIKDPSNAETYKANADTYCQQLDDLDANYQTAVDNAKFHTVLFGDRFPFRYLTDDYGLNYYAAFTGCSAETEASFETIVFLSAKLDELGLHHILTIEGSEQRIAETIVQNTQSKDQTILTMDSMQAITSEDIEKGISYLSIMQKNLGVLTEALN